MNFIFLSPHFPETYYRFCQRLKNMGVNVLGIGDKPFEFLRSEVINSLNEYYYIADMYNYDSILRASGYFTHRYGKLNRFESLNETWLEICDKARTDFNISGTKINQIALLKQKSRMKQIFQKANIPVADGMLIKQIEDIYSFIEKVEYPIIIKPDKGVAASHTYRIDNEKELKHFINIRPNIDFIMEKFITGQTYTFDGLTDQNGEIVFYASHTYNEGVMETINENLDHYYYSLREIPSDLEEIGKRSVKAFSLKETFFHIEFFRTDDNKLIAGEINARPPGGLTLDMFNYANNIDIYQQWANVIVYNRFDAKYSRPYHCAFAGRKLNKRYVYAHNEIMQEYDIYIPFYRTLPEFYHRGMGAYAYIVRAEKLDKLMEIINFIHKKEK